MVSALGPVDALGATAVSDGLLHAVPPARTEPAAHLLGPEPPSLDLVRVGSSSAVLSTRIRRGTTVRPRQAAFERLAFLNDVSGRTGGTLDLALTAADLVGACVPRFADFAQVQLIDGLLAGEDVSAPRSRDARLQVRAVSIGAERGDFVPTGQVSPWGESFALRVGSPLRAAVESRRPIHRARLHGPVLDVVAAELDRQLQHPALHRSGLLVAPLIARDTVIGNLVLLRNRERSRFDELDVLAAQELARRAALSLDNARRYQRESTIATTLQRSMLPVSPAELPGMDVAFRYRPGRRGDYVGGDWLDVIPLPGGRTAFTVGDVMGHGISAATVMGVLRTAIQTLAPLDLPPDQLLRQVDDLARRQQRAHPEEEGWLATCLFGVYDPVSRECAMASAGHIPPVLAGPGGVVAVLDLPTGAPIGVGGVAFETARFPVPDGSRLVMCTDGLIEVRGEDIGRGLAALCRRMAAPPQSLQETCDDLMHVVEPGERPDDAAVLIARFNGLPADRVASWTFAADARMVRHARGLTRRTLHQWGLDAVAGTVVLLIDELVTNVVQHGAGPITVRMLRAENLMCEVADTGGYLPRLKDAAALEQSGRGLRLVDYWAQRWGTFRTSTGKVVWFEHSLKA